MARIARRFLAVLAVSALLLPFLGPAMDHHFAERQHGHGHVYLGPALVDHQHPYDTDHAHFEPRESDIGAMEVVPLAGTTLGDIVYLASDDGIDQRNAAPFVPATQSTAIFPDPDSFLLAVVHQDNIPHGVFVAPLEDPPRM